MFATGLWLSTFMPHIPVLQVQHMRRAAHDNARLASSCAMPRDWLAAARDPAWQQAWDTALQRVAANITQEGRLPSFSEPCTCIVMEGVGVQALQLAAALQSPAGVNNVNRQESVDTAIASSSKFQVLSSHADPLGRFIAEQVVGDNATNQAASPRQTAGRVSDPGSTPTVQECACTPAIVGPSLPEWLQQEQQSEGLHQAAAVDGRLPAPAGTCPAPSSCPLLVCPDLVSSRLLSLHSLATQLSQALPFLAPGAAVSPLSSTLKAALVEGEQLVDQNRVDLEAMREHTGG
jgi:hypothetical protein